jgi:hypothetical protein
LAVESSSKRDLLLVFKLEMFRDLAGPKYFVCAILMSICVYACLVVFTFICLFFLLVLPKVKKPHLFVSDLLSEMVSCISHPNRKIDSSILFNRGVGMNNQTYVVDKKKEKNIYSVNDSVSNLEETSITDSEYSSDIIEDENPSLEEISGQEQSSSSSIYTRMTVVKSKRDKLKSLFQRLIKPLRRFFVCEARHVFRTGWENVEKENGEGDGERKEAFSSSSPSAHRILRKFHYRTYSVKKRLNKVLN